MTIRAISGLWWTQVSRVFAGEHARVTWEEPHDRSQGPGGLKNYKGNINHGVFFMQFLPDEGIFLPPKMTPRTQGWAGFSSGHHMKQYSLTEIPFIVHKSWHFLGLNSFPGYPTCSPLDPKAQKIYFPKKKIILPLRRTQNWEKLVYPPWEVKRSKI